MKKFAFVALAVLALILLASAADGSGCVVRQRAVYAAPVVQHYDYVAPIVQAVFVPVAIPAYSVAYADGAQSELQRLRAEIELQQLRNEFQQLKLQLQQGPPLPEKLQAPKKQVAIEEHPGVSVLRKNCASCHNSDKAFQKGNGFVLFDGDALAKFTDSDKLKIATAVFSGRMPKNVKGGLADGDVGQVMAWLDAAK